MQSVSTRHLGQDDSHGDFFSDGDGQPIKFRIQPGLSNVLKMQLEDGITLHGGLIISRIPIRGLVVIDPKSRIGRDFVREWAWNERPERRFVSFEFVLQCIDAKQMLVIDSEALKLEQAILRSTRTREAQPELSREAKDKMALYLATVLPDSARAARSSNMVYKHLVKNKHQYPWVGDYDWKIFRNYYCKNKKYYDGLISAIIEQRAGKTNLKAKPRSLPVTRRQFLIARKSNNNPESTVLEVILPSRKANAIEHFNEVSKKTVKFDRSFFIQRKRKFGDDVTNTKPRNVTLKKPRTIDDMLKAPLPSIVANRTKRKLFSEQISVSASSDVELGRGMSKNMRSDVWIDDKFQQNGADENRAASRPSRPQTSRLERFQESLSFYGMDLDDLRSAAALNEINNNDDVDCEDETSVAEILGLPAALSENLAIAQTLDPVLEDQSTSTKPSHRVPVRSDSRDHEATLSLAILELAQTTRFTVDEIKQKLAGFSGDMNKTRDFFMRCRQLVEDLFAGRAFPESGKAANLMPDE